MRLVCAGKITKCVKEISYAPKFGIAEQNKKEGEKFVNKKLTR
jgi:hypothetical protein